MLECKSYRWGSWYLTLLNMILFGAFKNSNMRRIVSSQSETLTPLESSNMPPWRFRITQCSRSSWNVKWGWKFLYSQLLLLNLPKKLCNLWHWRNSRTKWIKQLYLLLNLGCKGYTMEETRIDILCMQLRCLETRNHYARLCN